MAKKCRSSFMDIPFWRSLYKILTLLLIFYSSIRKATLQFVSHVFTWSSDVLNWGCLLLVVYFWKFLEAIGSFWNMAGKFEFEFELQKCFSRNCLDQWCFSLLVKRFFVYSGACQHHSFLSSFKLMSFYYWICKIECMYKNLFWQEFYLKQEKQKENNSFLCLPKKSTSESKSLDNTVGKIVLIQDLWSYLV